MKLLKLSPLVLLVFFFSGCDLFEDAADVNFNRVLTASINVNAGPDDQSVSDMVLIDAETDSEVQQYTDKIKEFKVNSITYSLSNYEGPSPCQFTNGTMRFSQSPTNPGNLVASVSSLDLSTASGQEIDLGAAENITNEIESFLKDGRKVYVYVEGNLSDTPASFTVQISFDITVTANPLN